MPLASILAALLGAVLIAWRFVVRWLRAIVQDGVRVFGMGQKESDSDADLAKTNRIRHF